MTLPAADPTPAADAAPGCASSPKAAKVRRAIDSLSGKWKLDILCRLTAGPVRFTALKRSLPGITQHVLAAQLRELEADGIVLRRAYAQMPPRVEYEMTTAGRELRPVAEALVAWAERHAPDAPAA